MASSRYPWAMGLLDRLGLGLKKVSGAKNQAAESAERRTHPRHGLGARTMVFARGEPSGVPALIRDISKGGCLLDTHAKVSVGTKLSLAFLCKPSGHCHAVGCVVRTDGESRFGVQFSKVNMAFLGFVGSVSSASPAGREELIAGMKGSTIEINAGS
jgi:hypothetical protein